MNLAKTKNWLLDNIIIVSIILVGLVLRLYKLEEYFAYSHDTDLIGWFYLDVFENDHLRLIGQETSTKGIFIGPLFYYLSSIFYLISDGNPVVGNLLVIILGLITIYSIYFVFSKVFSREIGQIGAFIYSISYYTVMNDREFVPTQPTILWAVWFLWSMQLWKIGKTKGSLMVLGILISLIWHINFSLLPLIFIYILNIFFSKTKIKFQQVKYLIFSALPLSLPLILFEMRHGFSQTKAFILALATNQEDIFTGLEKIIRIEYLISKNISSLFWSSLSNFETNYLSMVLPAVLIVIFFLKFLDKWHFLILLSWYAVIFSFFSIYSKPVSEYYLNNLALVYLGVTGVILTNIQKINKALFMIILVVFSWNAISRLTSLDPNKSGYVYRSLTLQNIKEDSLRKGYPCVSISYITKPGYNLGYRYLVFREGIKTKKISEDIPVYTIVYPLNDELLATVVTHGAIGLIYPDYDRYNMTVIQEKCAGEDYNMTEPMFGFTI